MPFFPHQKRAYNFTLPREGSGLFMEMGTMKTRVALARSLPYYKRILVVLPATVAGVWEKEAKTYRLPYIVIPLVDGSIQERAKALEALTAEGATDFPVVVLVNYEAYWRGRNKSSRPTLLRRAILRWQPQCVIWDEAHRIKHRGAEQSKMAHILGKQPSVKCRLALTGTPATAGVQDMFSIYKAIDPTIFGNSWGDFAAEYIMYGGFGNHEIIGYRNAEKARLKIEGSSFSCAKADVLDLPPLIDEEIPITLSTKARAIYDKLKKEAVAEVFGTSENGQPVTGRALALIVLTALLRLQQITGGFVKTDEGEIVTFSDEKLRATMDIINDCGDQQVVVFCRFSHDIKRLREELTRAGISHGEISGKIRRVRDRTQAQVDFDEGRTKVIVCQQEAGSLGIDLTAGSIAIFYSTGFRLDSFRQARDRLHRNGQTKAVTAYHLIAQNSVDEEIYKRLSEKQNIANALTPALARELLNVPAVRAVA